jgi:TRAP transporter TAXI family solute receptor
MTLKRAFRLLLDRITVAGPIFLLVVAGFVVAYQFVEPAPPDRLVLAAGPDGGRYRALAGEYADLLAREGVTLDIIETAGTAENIALLKNPDRHVDAAFVQTGVDIKDEAGAEGHVQSLGSLYLEPLWVFVRSGYAAENGLRDLEGRRVVLGAEGSGTRVLAERLLAAEAVSVKDVTVTGPDAQADALMRGEVDALFIVGSPGLPIIERLIKGDGVYLLNLPEAEALSRYFRDLFHIVLPTAVLDLARVFPPEEVEMLAATANLAVQEDLHPALKELLVLTARKIHGPAGLLNEAGAFPSADHLAYPLSDEARRIYERGPSFLQRYLPFWAANLVDRFLIMLLPLITLALPLIRVMPPMYRWRVRRRIYRWYRDLMGIERQIFEGGADPDKVLDELYHVERETAHVEVPLSYADELYNLRLHIQYLRGLVREQENR